MAEGLTPKERSENQINHFAKVAYTRLLALSDTLADAKKHGVEIGLAGELELLPVIQDVKKYFKK